MKEKAQLSNQQIIEQCVCTTCRKPLVEVDGKVVCSTQDKNHSGFVSIASLRREQEWEANVDALDMVQTTFLGKKHLSREEASKRLYGDGDDSL